MKLKTRDLTRIALMTVVITVCSWLTIPFTVPFTMQTFAIFLALRLLGGRHGVASIGIYILLGAVGVPVFSGFSGGVGTLLGPTGGYIFGFLFTGLAYCALEKLPMKRAWMRIAMMFAELCMCYLLGTLWFTKTFTSSEPITFASAMMLCVVPYILPDLAKLVLVEVLTGRLQKTHLFKG